MQCLSLALQVDGFEYVCVLGGATLPAPYNATDGSVMCTILEDEGSYMVHKVNYEIFILVCRSQLPPQ